MNTSYRDEKQTKYTEMSILRISIMLQLGTRSFNGKANKLPAETIKKFYTNPE